MSLLARSQLRFVAHSPWSAATALLGVTLGVASVVAVHLIGAAVVRTLDAASSPHLAGLTHMLECPHMDADAYFDLRRRWREHPESRVEALVPIVEGYAIAGERRVRVLGADWLAMPSMSPDSARSLAVSTDVLVGEAVVVDASLGLVRGDRAIIGERSYRVAGVRDGGVGPAVIADIGVAQVMLGRGPDAVTRVGLAVHDPWQSWRGRLDRLMPGFGAGLPAPRGEDLAALAPELEAGESGCRALPVAAESPSAQFARAVLFDLGALGTLALLVAWFLIYQVGVIWLRRQHLLLERLHALGVSQQALERSFVSVFLLLGTLATVAGLGAGALLASLLTELATRGLDTSGSRVPGVVDVDFWVVAKAVGSGLGVCALAGVGAFSRAWPPRPQAAPRPRLWRSALLLLLAIAVAVGIGVEGSGVIGGFLAIFAMSLAGVVLVSPLLALLRRVAARPRGSLLTRLALRDVAWHPQMLGVALAALSLAVATSIGIGLMVESFRADFDRMLTMRLAGDLFVDLQDAPAGPVRAWLEGRPEVAAVTGSGRDTVRVDGVPVELGYGRFDGAESGRYGFARALGSGEALVSERLARDLNVERGDRLRVARGALTVVGSFPDFGNATGRVLVDTASLDRVGVAPHVDRLMVTLAPDTGAVTALAGRLAMRFPSLAVESRREIRQLALRVFDHTFAITRALTLLALLVAVVGTYNALTALRLQQAPTTLLLRSEGVSRRQIRRVTVIRACAVGGLAMLVAAPLGLAMAWTLCTVINPRSFGWSVDLHVPLSGWLPPLALGMAASVLAGVLPSPRERGTLHESA